MPSEKLQQVYGALFKDSKGKTSAHANGGGAGGLGSSSSSISASAGFTTSSRGPGSAYKAFEKQTIDDWDIDNDDDSSFVVNHSLSEFYFPISVQDSEEVAKRIIKSHQEKFNSPKSSPSSQKSADPKTSLSPVLSTGGGPGKALRQENKSDLSSLTSGLKSVSMRNEKRESANNNTKSPETPSLEALSNARVTKTTMNTPESKPSSLRSELTNGMGNQARPAKYSPPVYTYSSQNEDQVKCEKFKQILETDPVDINELHKASWKGIPKAHRSVCWKILSDYLPLKHELREKTIEQKRSIYWDSVSEYYSSGYLESHHDILRQILNDIPRMNPLISIFQQKIVQDIFQRVLYVWAIRHPATGYVQGINDLLTPFFVVFLTDYVDPSVEIRDVVFEKIPTEQLRQLEADCYWCMNKLLERIQENYVFLQPGIQKKIQALEDLIKRIDKNLYQHFKKNSIDFIQFAFRWMNNLLMREIPLNCTIRLWDTYHAEHLGFSDFHLYVCAAFLLRYSKNLLEEKDFQGLMIFLQNLPTRNLKENDIDVITAEAYKLQVMFANSPNHTLN